MENNQQNSPEQPPVNPAPNVVYVSAPAPRQPRRVNHGMHFVLTLLTFGFWIPIWILDAIITTSANNMERNQ